MDNVAVVILNYNGESYLRKFLPGVIAHTPKATMVVADNASTDQSLTYLKENHPEVQLIEMPENLGFSGGYNRALTSVKASYYVLLNSDVEVTANWLEPLIQWMHDHPETAICQPKIKSHHQKDHFEYAGAAGGWIDILGYPFCRGRIFNSLEQDEGQYDANCPIFWAGGACLVVRAEIFHQLGGFDPDFFAHMEEIDLCWRAQNAGYGVHYIGASTIYHVGGGTLSVANPRKTYLNFRNGFALLVKNEAVAALWWKLPLRLLLDFIAALRFLLSNWGHFAAVIKAQATYLTHLVNDFRKRGKVKPMRTLVGVYCKSVVIAYFLMGKNKFQELDLKNAK